MNKSVFYTIVAMAYALVVICGIGIGVTATIESGFLLGLASSGSFVFVGFLVIEFIEIVVGYKVYNVRRLFNVR